MAESKILLKTDFVHSFEIVQNTDLDNVTMPGIYVASSAVAGTAINSPMGSASFALQVKRVSNTTGVNRIQTIQSGSTIYTRMKTSSGWSAWVRIARETDIYDEFEEMASTDGSSFNKNFLGISTATQRHNYHKRASFTLTSSTLSDFTNVPPVLSTKAASTTVVGVREVYYRSSTNILVKVTELTPDPGLTYTNWYNGSWLGWKSTISQNRVAASLTLNTNLTGTAAYAVEGGHLVTVTVRATPKTTQSNTINIANIPEAYRPKHTVIADFALLKNTSTKEVSIAVYNGNIYSDGNIRQSYQTSWATTSEVSMVFHYFI